MQFPTSFNATQRAQLDEKIKQVTCIALHSYQTASKHSSAQGAILLANAVEDTTRLNRPAFWDAIVLFVSANSAEILNDKLQSVNEHCPLTCFVEAQRFAQSLVNLNTHKMQVPTGKEQGTEWQTFNDCRTIPALSKAFNDGSLALVNNEGQNSISNIDSELTTLESLKTDRNNRLALEKFNGASINAIAFDANSARSLADAIKTMGDNNMHWAYIAFVGNEDLAPISELFL